MHRFVTLVAILLAPVVARAQSTGVVFAPGDDAYVSSATPDASFPRSERLPVGADRTSGAISRSFVQFALPRGGEILSATLHGRYAGADTSNGIGTQVFELVAHDAWTPSTLTWTSQPPASGEIIATVDPSSLSVFDEIAIDVTELARREQARDGRMSVRIAAAVETDRRRAAWRSREDIYARGFHLTLVVGPAPVLEAGDVLTISQGGFYAGVVAIDPEERVQKALGPMRMIQSMRGIAIDPRDGSLLAQDTDGIVRIDEDGNPSPLATYRDGFAYPNAAYLAASSDGFLYVAALESGIVRIDLDTGEHTTLSQGGELCRPNGVAIAGDALVVSDRCGHLVRVSLANGAQHRIASTASLIAPEGVAIDVQGDILVCDEDGSGGGRILRIDPSDGSHASVASLPFAPGPLARADDGTWWVASRPQGLDSAGFPVELGRVDPTTGIYASVLQASLWSSGFALAPDGAPLLAMDRSEQVARIDRVDPASGTLRTIAAPMTRPTSASSGGRRALALDARRQLLAVLEDRVLRVDPRTGRQSLVATTRDLACGSALACSFNDVTRGPDGRLGLLELAFTPITSLAFDWLDPARGTVEQVELSPWLWTTRIEADATGALLFGVRGSGSYPAAIERYEPATGTYARVTTGGTLGRIDDLALDRSGALYVSDGETRRVTRVDVATGAQQPMQLPLAARRMEVDQRGRIVAWGEISEQLLARYDPGSGDTVALATAAELWGNGMLATVPPRCSNDRDDDGDGAVDHPADRGCADPDDDSEGTRCGLGAELALVLIGFAFVRARGSRRVRSEWFEMRSVSARH